ncbi:hypothetical protein F4778DRAFT_703433 [Xylariomycetidae sp. FL2044]|nr:hypothetical protein F4778DRAFT_703433 [Xylariomycetidae sp. FL2044]
MAASVQVIHSSASSPRQRPAATSAPVLDFVCLFTHDLRRKQKRWQDGRIKYHTFNKRVMVYDDRGNFVGDAHWREDYDLCDGDEVELERGGVIVQVAECTGSRDQDLSELLDKRAQEKAERQSAGAARRHPTLEPPTPNAVTPHFQLRHKPLHHLIGTPTGHHGRALLPTESPYEERQRAAESPREDASHPAKRRKRDMSPPSKSGYATSLFGASLTLSGRPMSSAPMRRQPPKVPQPRSESSPPPPPSDTSNQDGNLVESPNGRRFPIARPRLGLTQNHSRPLLSVSKPPSRFDAAFCSSPPRDQVERAADEKEDEEPEIVKVVRRVPAPRLSAEHEPLNSISVNSKRRGPGVQGRETGSKGNKLSRQPPTEAPKPTRDIRQANEFSQPRQTVSRGIEPQEQEMSDTRQRGSDLPQRRDVNNPRTGLCINPRKKRGLLMVAEKAAEMRSRAKRKAAADRTDHPSLRTSLRPPTSMEEEYGERSSRPASAVEEDIDGHDTRKSDEETMTTKKRKSRADTTAQDNAASTSETQSRVVVEHRSSGPSMDDVFEDGSSGRSLRRQKRTKTVATEGPSWSEVDQEERLSSRDNRRQPTGNEPESDEDDWPVEPMRVSSVNINKDSSKKFDEEGFKLQEGVPPPRLARLPRKSVRSKEVIGFIFDESDTDTTPRPSRGNESNTSADIQRIETVKDPSMAHGSGKPGVAIIPPRVEESLHTTKEVVGGPEPGRNCTGEAIQLEPMAPLLQRQENTAPVQSNEHVDRGNTAAEAITTNTAQPHPKIANPATRGRKAAKPADAAGQVPRCPLPPGQEPAAAASRNPKQKPGQVSGNQDNTKSLPGFTRVTGGGPWSREAYDLFEFKRPT